MGISEFIKESRRILRLATKPSKTELWLSTRVSLLAMIAVGMLSFIIQVLMTTVTSGWGG
ncbi:MAG: protein translocase SEC61 complex subunit gamma [Candidatus Thorarchaeota archaeon]